MAKIIKHVQPEHFESFDIVITVDSQLKADLYGNFFGNPWRMAQFMAKAIMEETVSADEIEKLIDDEFRYEAWRATFRKQNV